GLEVQGVAVLAPARDDEPAQETEWRLPLTRDPGQMRLEARAALRADEHLALDAGGESALTVDGTEVEEHLTVQHRVGLGGPDPVPYRPLPLRAGPAPPGVGRHHPTGAEREARPVESRADAVGEFREVLVGA